MSKAVKGHEVTKGLPLTASERRLDYFTGVGALRRGNIPKADAVHPCLREF